MMPFLEEYLSRIIKIITIFEFTKQDGLFGRAGATGHSGAPV